MSSILNEKMVVPDDKQLSYAIGKTKKFLDEILSYLEKEYGNIKTEWKFYGQKYGWQLKVFHKKRNLMFLIPYNSYFKIGMVFGDKAIERIVEENKLPENIIQELLNAKKYMEGRGISIDVKSQKECDIIIEMLKIKIKY